MKYSISDAGVMAVDVYWTLVSTRRQLLFCQYLHIAEINLLHTFGPLERIVISVLYLTQFHRCSYDHNLSW